MSDEFIKKVTEELQKEQFSLSLSINSYQQLHEELSKRVNFLITNNFSLLISILYRLDISEKRLKQLLNATKEGTAGEVIAQMIIERQLQKILCRKSLPPDPNVPEDEKW